MSVFTVNVLVLELTTLLFVLSLSSTFTVTEAGVLPLAAVYSYAMVTSSDRLLFTSTLPTFTVILSVPLLLRVVPSTSVLKISLVVLIIAFDKSSELIVNVASFVP